MKVIMDIYHVPIMFSSYRSRHRTELISFMHILPA